MRGYEADIRSRRRGSPVETGALLRLRLRRRRRHRNADAGADDRRLERDQRLVDAQLLFVGDVSGPESFAAAPEALYTGLADGRIVRLIHGEITKLNPIRRLEVETIARTGEALDGCGTRELEPACGRPHGLRIARARDIAPGCETDEFPCRADEKVRAPFQHPRHACGHRALSSPSLSPLPPPRLTRH